MIAAAEDRAGEKTVAAEVKDASQKGIQAEGALLGKVAGSQPVMAKWDAANAAKGALALEAIEDTDKAFRRVERFDTRATESFESLHIRIRPKFCQNSGHIFTILQKS